MKTSFWDKIEKIAKRLKVPDGTIRTWKHRGFIPHHWRIPLFQAACGSLTLSEINTGACDVTNCNKQPVKRKHKR